MANCNRCSQKIVWPQPYQKGNKPLNENGTMHNCLPGGEDHQMGQQPIPDPQLPDRAVGSLSKVDVRFQEIDKLDQMLFKVSTDRLKAVAKELKIEDVIDPNNALVFVESWARTLAQALR